METLDKIEIKPANKILNLDKYIFVELAEAKADARARGINLIDLGIGNPDGETAKFIVKKTIKSIKNPINHGYPDFRGKDEFQTVIKSWMKKRYDVDLDNDFIAQAVNGGKEGIAHCTMAFTNEGDVNIVPVPYYPVLSRATWVSGAEAYHVPLLEENGFLPDLSTIPEDIAKKAKIFIINYPNNPTGAYATREFLEELVAFCRKYSILIISDLAYGEVCFDDFRPLSIFNIEGARDVALEVHTCSKTFNMAGWRVGFVLGKKELIDSVFAMKLNFDYGTSTIMQDAAIAAMTMPYKYVKKTMQKYQKRRDFLVKSFNELGWDLQLPHATMYLWPKVPKSMTSREFCTMVMEKTGVVFTPGIAFGHKADGYFRVSLVQDMKLLKEAIKRLKDAGIRYEN